jgi:hypothetical protein
MSLKCTKITADFSTKTLKSRKSWSEVSQALKENNFSIGYSTQQNNHKKIDGGIKHFHNKQKLKQYMTTKPPL